MLGQFEEIVRDRVLTHEESSHFREMNERSDFSARLPMTEVQTSSHQLKVAQDHTSEFHDNFSDTQRAADERDRADPDSQLLRKKRR